MIRIVGVDLSLVSTGVAGGAWTERIEPKRLTGHQRLQHICDHLAGYTRNAALVVVEGPSFGSIGKGQHERGGLWWMVTHQLWRAGTPFAVVPPSNLKQYATGKGGAGKDDVLREVTKRFPWFEGGNDEADALWLAAMGHDWAGQPIVAVPATHRKALTAVDWPDMAAAEQVPA